MKESGKMKETVKQDVLDNITNFYLGSDDFNGLPVVSLVENFDAKELLRALTELIEEDNVSVVFGNVHPNPHIRALPDMPKQGQIDKLRMSIEENGLDPACAYPLSNHLHDMVDRSQYENRPYMLAMALGTPQLDYKAFDLSVLEFYRNDPRYMYVNDDISGSISISDEYFESGEVPESDEILLQTFGFCYDDALNRAVSVFVRYLADLSPEHQQIWKAKELQGDYKLHPDYYRNSILGDFGEGVSIFDAFVEELKLVNKMAAAMERPALFRDNFSSKPRKFGFLVRPTLEAYNDFVLLLDKMLSDNTNKKFFQNEVPSENETERPDGKIEVRQIGTLSMLENWICKYFRTDEWEPVDEMIKAFKGVRKQRQKPAHAVDENVFDQKYFHEQRNLIQRAYGGVRTLQLLLANHPKVRASNIEIHPVLYEGKIWSY